MNEGLFGQYSVFCVFGSVVGCVVVPLIAQVLQQQSMECMILSAIVLSLTAAHLNKKCVTGNQNAKVNLSKEYDKRKTSQSKRSKCPTNTHHNHPTNSFSKSITSRESRHNEAHYPQQFEHLKVVEMERRQEEKRLRKLQKREERLKRKEEENRKQKELEERYRLIKEKRYKDKEKQLRNRSSCSDDSFEKVKANDWTKSLPTHGFNHYESLSTKPVKNSMNSVNANWRAKGNCGGSLMVRNSNITASCSSLSSIGSNDSASSSPVPTFPPCTKSAWKCDSKTMEAKSCWNKLQPDIVETIGSQLDNCSNLISKTYSGLPSIVSSSLFSSNHDHSRKSNAGATDTVAEYKLFGPRKVEKPSLSMSMF